MLRRAHENGISQPTNQSISQNKDTSENKLNCIAMLSFLRDKLLFYFIFLVEWGGKEER